MHTNMDAAKGGVNHKIAEKLGLTSIRTFGNIKRVLSPITSELVEGAEGLMGDFTTPIAADDLIIMLKKHFDVECVQANQLLRREIKTVALCGGAGSFLVEAAVKAGADAFITGDMSYHEFFGYEQIIQLCAIGHYQSEQFTSEIFKEIIERDCLGVKCFLTEINTNPIIYL